MRTDVIKTNIAIIISSNSSSRLHLSRPAAFPTPSCIGMERKIGLDDNTANDVIKNQPLAPAFAFAMPRAGLISPLTLISLSAASNRAYVHGGIEAIVFFTKPCTGFLRKSSHRNRSCRSGYSQRSCWSSRSYGGLHIR